MILAIDQALTTTGICYLSKDGEMETFKVKTTAKEPWIDRMNSILSTLESVANLSAVTLANASKVEHVILESYAFGGSMKGFVLGELGGIIKYHFYSKGYTPKQVLIAHPKMYIARHGRADKKLVKSALAKRFLIVEKDHNVADAIAIALTYRRYLDYLKQDPDINKTISPYDRAVFAKMKGHLHD